MVVDQFVRTGTVRLEFHDVLNHGEYSLRASEAAACAGRQGQFWQMHGLLFEKQDEVYAAGPGGLVDLMLRFGAQLDGLDQASFSQCLADRATLEALQAADAEQRVRGIVFQPVFEIVSEIGERRLAGFQPFEVMESAIDEMTP